MSIVTVNVTQNVGSTPSQLQRTGALVSTGGTSLAANASSLLTQLSDLTPLLAGAVAITSATESGTTITVTTTTPHGFTTGDSVTIAGFTTAGYNGTQSITVTGASTFTYPGASSLVTPAVGTGVATDADVAELVAMVTTLFAQGSNVAVYVLELGHGTVTANIAAFAAYLTANPLKYYRYLIPRGWDADSTFVTLVGLYNSTTAKVYFHVTATLSTYASFTVANGKSVLMTIEAPDIPATEFTSAALMWVALNYNPSGTNQVTPYGNSFLANGSVTMYPITSTQAVTFKTANLNYVSNGAEGGISNLLLVNGTQCDGNPLNYWYSVDWFQINGAQTLAAAVINGSNNPSAPLDYDQPGINSLETKLVGTAGTGVSYGLAVGPVTSFQLSAAAFTALIESGNAPLGVLVNAVPFVSYVALNPNDYPIGKYAGLSMSLTPARGFQNIVFNLQVSNFIP